MPQRSQDPRGGDPGIGRPEQFGPVRGTVRPARGTAWLARGKARPSEGPARRMAPHILGDARLPPTVRDTSTGREARWAAGRARADRPSLAAGRGSGIHAGGSRAQPAAPGFQLGRDRLRQPDQQAHPSHAVGPRAGSRHAAAGRASDTYHQLADGAPGVSLGAGRSRAVPRPAGLAPATARLGPRAGGPGLRLPMGRPGWRHPWPSRTSGPRSARWPRPGSSCAA